MWMQKRSLDSVPPSRDEAGGGETCHMTAGGYVERVDVASGARSRPPT